MSDGAALHVVSVRNRSPYRKPRPVDGLVLNPGFLIILHKLSLVLEIPMSQIRVIKPWSARLWR